MDARIIGERSDAVLRTAMSGHDTARAEALEKNNGLLADEERSVIELFGVWGQKKFMGRTYDGIHRYTFVLENEVVTRVFDKVNTANHAAQILES